MSAPAWDGCELVRDKAGNLWTISARSPVDGAPVYASVESWMSESWTCEYSTAEVEARFGPCAPVLGPEGEPVVTATDIDEITDVLLDVQYPSRADVERAAKRRLYVWEAQQ